MRNSELEAAEKSEREFNDSRVSSLFLLDCVTETLARNFAEVQLLLLPILQIGGLLLMFREYSCSKHTRF